ncbi:MAG: hypothetical protein J6S43_04675, partial [Lentisphaeria bacterium]|nr:hypothetical protein [Lentisphaeria bacterium]
MKKIAGKLPVKKLTAFRIVPELSSISAYLEKVFAVLGLKVGKTAENAVINFKYAPMTDGAWQMTVTPEGITATAGDLRGASYAANALAQMLFAATIKSLPDDALNCAEIADEPRF